MQFYYSFHSGIQKQFIWNKSTIFHKHKCLREGFLSTKIEDAQTEDSSQTEDTQTEVISKNEDTKTEVTSKNEDTKTEVSSKTDDTQWKTTSQTDTQTKIVSKRANNRSYFYD